jgi:hypothetical protein
VTWEPGKDRIDQLLADDELEQVTPDTRVAERLLEDAERHLTTAAGPSADDVTDAIKTATEAKYAATTILERDVLTPW